MCYFCRSKAETRRMDEKTIDIEKILKGKLGPKAKFVPSFLVNWLKRIAHQDQVNAFLWESRDKKGVEWLEECVKYLDMTLEIEGKENLPSPDDGRLYTFVSNHPLGGEDGVALGAIIGRHYDGRFRYQDRQPEPQFPRNGRGRIQERQPHADVPCWPLLPQEEGRHQRYPLDEDLRLEECGIPARRGTHPLRRTKLELLLPTGQLQRQMPALQSGHALSRR